jgi:hypothetical protein
MIGLGQGFRVPGFRVHRKSEALIRGIWDFVGFSSLYVTLNQLNIR